MAGAAVYPWNSSSTVTPGAFAPGYSVPPQAGARGGSIQADSPELYETNRAEYWKQKGYKATIFEKELGFWDSLFHNDLKDDVLAQDTDFLRAARIVYEAKEGKPWPGAPTKSNEDLTEWAMSHMRAVKINSVKGGWNAWENSNAPQHIQDAYKYIGDAYDAKDWTAMGLLHGLKWGILDPINAIGGGFIAKGGMAVVKASGATGFFKTAGTFIAKTVLPAFGLGAGSNALQSVTVEQSIDYNAQAQEDRISGANTAYAAAIGGTMGAGFSVVGGGIAGAAGKAFGKKAGNAASNAATPNYSRDPGVKASEIKIEKMAQPDPGIDISKAKIDLPEFEYKRDWAKFFARRNWKPYQLFTEWKVPLRSMWVRSEGVTRPVINAIDKRFSELGLTGKPVLDSNGKIKLDSGGYATRQNGFIDQMQDDVLAVLERNGSKQDAVNILDNLKHDQTIVKALEEAETDLQALRAHVGKVDYKINDRSTQYYGLTAAQKEALIETLTDFIKITKELRDGSQGEIGQEILHNFDRIKKGELDLDEVRNSITGLSRANWIANESYTRLTGYWPNGDMARIQSPRSLERNIDQGVYGYDHPWMAKPVTYRFLGDKDNGENFEYLWQNEMLDRIAKRNEDGKKIGVDWYADAQAVDTFFSNAVALIDKGFGHRVLFTLDNLNRLKQHDTDFPDFQTIPPAGKLQALAEANPRYGTDKLFTKMVDLIIERAHLYRTSSKGNEKATIMEGLFGNNRPNQFKAFKNLYPYVYGFEWADRPSGAPWFMTAKLSPLRYFFGETALSLPGFNYVQNRYKWGPIQHVYYYFGGAKNYRAEGSDAWNFNQNKKQKSWYDVFRKDWIETDEKLGKETRLAQMRRIMVRWPSFGMIDDIPSFNPFKWKLTETGRFVLPFGGTVAAPAFAAAAIEGGYEWYNDENITPLGYDLDLGGRVLEGQLKFADLTAGSAFRFVTRSDAHIPYQWTGQGMFGDRYEITEEKALKALMPYRLENGKLVPRNGPEDNSIAFHPKTAIVIKKLAENDADITDPVVLQRYFDAARGVTPTAGVSQGASGHTAPNPGSGAGGTSGGGTQSGQPNTVTPNPAPNAGQNSGGGGGGASSSPQGSGTPYAQQAFNPASLYNNNDQSFMRSAGGWTADLFRSAAGHSPTASGAVDTIAHGISGLWGSVFEQDYEGKDDIIKWGGGLIGAYLGTMLITNTVPGTKWAGLFIFALLALWLPGVVASVRQGDGKFLPAGVKDMLPGNDNNTDHQGTAKVERVVFDSTNSSNIPWQEMRAVMKAGETQWALQVHNKDGSSFVPNNFEAITQASADTPFMDQVMARAANDGTFIRTESLDAKFDEDHEWVYDAISHRGNNVIVLRNTRAAANDPQYYVLDVADP